MTCSDPPSANDPRALLVKHGKQWAYQQERGEQTGSLHWQCRVSLQEKCTEARARTLFPSAHISPTSNANKGNRFYVMKEDTRVAGPWTSEDVYVPKQVRRMRGLLPWQQSVVDKCEFVPTTDAELDEQERAVDVIVDTRGGQGKTKLGLWLATKGKGHILPCVGDRQSLIRSVQNRPPRSIYLVDIPRAGLNKKQMTELIAGIEQIKSGYITDERFRWKETFMDSPHVWVFCNRAPDTALLTGGRWRFWRINDAMQLVSVDPIEFQ